MNRQRHQTGKAKVADNGGKVRVSVGEVTRRVDRIQIEDVPVFPTESPLAIADQSFQYYQKRFGSHIELRMRFYYPA